MWIVAIFVVIIGGIIFFVGDATTAALTVIVAIFLALIVLILGMTGSDVSDNDSSKKEQVQANNDIATKQINDSLVNASEEYKKFQSLLNKENATVQQSTSVYNQQESDTNIIRDTIVALRRLKLYGGELSENASFIIEKIQHIENMDPGKASIVKRIDNLHKNYYPVLAHAINSFIKVGKSSKDYKGASKKLNESLESFIDALDSIIEENAVGDIAEMSVDLNVLDSMMKKDGLKDQVKIKL